MREGGVDMVKMKIIKLVEVKFLISKTYVKSFQGLNRKEVYHTPHFGRSNIDGTLIQMDNATAFARSP